VAAAASAAKLRVCAKAVESVAVGASVAGSVAGIKEGFDGRPGRTHKSGGRPKVVVLGSGWGAATFIQGLSKEDAAMYDVKVVSPRNFFLYTPLLPACTMGCVEEGSIMTPVRRLIEGKAEYLEAKCESIDTVTKVVRCCRAGGPARSNDVNYERFPEGDVEGKLTFDVEYDILIYAVGAQTNDFNTPGVQEHSFFFKEVQDAHKVRQKVTDLFEMASLPNATKEDKDRLLSFVIVGGGPTGVEVAADFADFCERDAIELYPKLVEHIKISLINTGDNLLSTYDQSISKTCMEVFKQKGVDVMARCKVVEVTPEEIKMKRGKEEELFALPYGCVVWAAGIKENLLTTQFKASLIERNEGISELNVKSLKSPIRGIVTDEHLGVRGSGGSIFALGDAALVRHDRTEPFAEQLFKAADLNGNGELDLLELRELFIGAADAFPQLEDYAAYLKEVVEVPTEDDSRMAKIAKIFEESFEREKLAFRKALSLTSQMVGDRTKRTAKEAVAAEVDQVLEHDKASMNLEEFRRLLVGIDKNLQHFPPTAQIAAQQGKYLAGLLSEGVIDGTQESYAKTMGSKPGFSYFHKGSLAYLGGGSAAFDLPIIGAVTGPAAGVVWKLYETSAQLSWKNRALVGLDWVKNEIFGGNTSLL